MNENTYKERIRQANIRAWHGAWGGGGLLASCRGRTYARRGLRTSTLLMRRGGRLAPSVVQC
jgi:hypothetical protein